MSQENLQALIEGAFEERAQLSSKNVSSEIKNAVETVIDELDKGSLRVAEKINDTWVTHQWIKKAILLSFKIHDSSITEIPGGAYFDKIPLKFQNYNAERFLKEGIRACPGCIVRRGSYLENGVILLPSFVNIGAHVGSGTMVDTWATVGSCAQVGRNVHIAGGAGIGGVLEPLQAGPTIIEDNVFIGARSEVVEGVIVGEGSVISMGVFLGKSTRIYDRTTGEISYGYIPPHSVVVAGNLPSKDGKYSLYAAIIVKHVDEKTRSKVGLNELLRQAQEEIHN